MFGCGAFRLYALGVDATTTSAEALIAFDLWFGRVAIVGAVVALLSALSLLFAVTANMAGSAVAMLDPGTIGKVLSGTSFGRVWCWHLGICRSAGRRLPCAERALADPIHPRRLVVAAGQPGLGRACGRGPRGGQARPSDQSDGAFARRGTVARRVGSFGLAAPAGGIPGGRVLDFSRSRCGATLFADGVCRGCASCRDRRDQHAVAGRERRGADQHTLWPSAGSEAPAVSGDGRRRAIQPFSPAAAACSARRSHRRRSPGSPVRCCSSKGSGSRFSQSSAFSGRCRRLSTPEVRGQAEPTL